MTQIQMIKEYLKINDNIQCDYTLLVQLAMEVAATLFFENEANSLSKEIDTKDTIEGVTRVKGQMNELTETGLFQLFFTSKSGLQRTHDILKSTRRTAYFWEMGVNSFSPNRYPLYYQLAVKNPDRYNYQRYDVSPYDDVILITKAVSLEMPDDANSGQANKVPLGVFGALLDRNTFLNYLKKSLIKDQNEAQNGPNIDCSNNNCILLTSDGKILGFLPPENALETGYLQPKLVRFRNDSIEYMKGNQMFQKLTVGRSPFRPIQGKCDRAEPDCVYSRKDNQAGCGIKIIQEPEPVKDNRFTVKTVKWRKRFMDQSGWYYSDPWTAKVDFDVSEPSLKTHWFRCTQDLKFY